MTNYRELPQLYCLIYFSEDEAISSFDMDGICGLAFDGLAVITTPSLLQSVKANYPHLSQVPSHILISSLLVCILSFCRCIYILLLFVRTPFSPYSTLPLNPSIHPYPIILLYHSLFRCI